jgi:4-amino-4-deoxy-L-arabinose transferase-like glycosyltransferase
MLKRIKKFITFEYVFVFAILLIAFALRVLRVGEILDFNYDQGRDALVIWDLIHKGKLFLIGPTTGIPGIFRGPFYYYLIAPFYLLGKGNPVWPAIFLTLTSVAALGLMYFLGKKIGGKVVGVIALILGAFSVEIMFASRWLSNPTPMLLLSMILVWMLLLIYEGKKWPWAVVSVVLGLSLFHLGSSGEVFYFPIVAIFAIWKFFFSKGKVKNIPNLKIIITSIGLFIFTILPLVLFDLKHGGILGGSIKGFLGEGKSFGLPAWIFVTDRLSLIGNYFVGLLFHNPFNTEWLFITAFALIALFFLSRLIKNAKLNIILLFLVVPTIGIVFFQGNYGNFYGYYLTGYYLTFLIFIAVTLSYIFKSSLLGKIFVTVFMAFFLIHNFSDIKIYLDKSTSDNGAIKFGNQKQVIDWIYKDVGDRVFNVDCYVPPVITYSYDYLFKWLGTNKYGKLPVESQTPLLYTLYEADPPHPERLEAWLVRQKGIGKVIKEETFGGITVQERERITIK